ncbi:MAG TPA: MarR family transcriptional regulator [Herpetosiphonaceae bacterium]|nr:MarR family transcriptional regulator [Herpetosiphonaceae bacterium]
MEEQTTTDSRQRRLAVLAWLRLTRVFQKIERASAEHFRRWNLSAAQFDVLAQLGPAEGITQQELANKLYVTKGNVCQLLDKMEQSGLVVREQHGRSNRLYLTESGHRLFDETVPSEEAVLAEMFSALTLDEQAQLLALLRKLDHALG